MLPKIQKGSVLIYRVFDVAEEVNLQRVLSILGSMGAEARLDLSARNRTAVVLRNAPIRFGLDEVRLQIAGVETPVEMVATIWDYGALSIQIQIAIEKDTPWNKLLSLASTLNVDVPTIKAIDALAQRTATEICDLLGSAFTRPNSWPIFEDYTIYFLEQVEGIRGVELSKKTDLSALILGEEKDQLAAETKESILANLFQYADDDLVLVDWNAAVVLEPTGIREIPDILEFALTHLLELRYFDELLDTRLKELYDSIETGRSKLFMKTFGEIAEEANTRFIEFSEFMERIGNSLKVVGDFYLARIFRAAIRRFRIHDWQENINRKMNLLAQVSQLLQGENNVRRSHILEVIVVLLILFEIVSALVIH